MKSTPILCSSKESFITKATAIYSDRYNYNDVQFIHEKICVSVGCNKCHQIFLVTPYYHLKNHQCNTCYGQKPSRSRYKEDYIEKMTNRHDGKFDYSCAYYVHNKHPILIRCTKHDLWFMQQPAEHLGGLNGCMPCSDEYNKELRKEAARIQWIKMVNNFRMIYGDDYDYSNSKYIEIHTHVDIYCNIHKRHFKKDPANHERGQRGCPDCTYENLNRQYDEPKRLKFESIMKEIKEIHKDRGYDFSCFDPFRLTYSSVVLCSEHGYFETTTRFLKDGHGCTHCKNKTQGLLYNYLRSIYPNVKSEKTFDWCRSMKGGSYRYDFVIDNVIVELDGDQHFNKNQRWGEVIDTRVSDIIKMFRAIQNGYHMIRIYQPDYAKNPEGINIHLFQLIDQLKNSDDYDVKFYASPLYDSMMKKYCAIRRAIRLNPICNNIEIIEKFVRSENSDIPKTKSQALSIVA